MIDNIKAVGMSLDLPYEVSIALNRLKEAEYAKGRKVTKEQIVIEILKRNLKIK